ncbi:chemotaxis protein CheW [Rhodoferax bucti]|uniref:chemotaxis protein CheW n=1 Tax=Rhodoferax bucti TaxID=2576305 RepID=UPI0011086CA5|nr:chemotaxis protein CheW [Rhodoferax bucti]
MSLTATAPVSTTSLPVGQAPSQVYEYLAFKIGQEEYGVDILRVQEIRSYEKPTALANMPESLKGVINLRGVIVPIIDMRIKFRQEQALYNELTVVIVLNVGNRIVGAVVDSVSDVVTLEPHHLKPAPAFGNGFQPGHITALGSVDDRMLILLNMDQLLEGEEALRSYALTH